jgi:hypothetical protein
VLGILQSIILTWLDGRSLLPALQYTKGEKMYLTQAYYDILDNMLWLAQGIHSQSTSWEKYLWKICLSNWAHKMPPDMVWAG